MNRILPVLSTLGIIALSGCASMAPKEVRRVEYVEPTKTKKTVAYSKALAFLAKNLGDSNYAIKVQDKESGQIITKMTASCNALRQWGDVNEYMVDFNLDFQAKDNKIKMTFEDIEMRAAESGKGTLSFSYQQVSDGSKVEKVKLECLEPIKKSLLASITSGSSDW